MKFPVIPIIKTPTINIPKVLWRIVSSIPKRVMNFSVTYRLLIAQLNISTITSARSFLLLYSDIITVYDISIIITSGTCTKGYETNPLTMMDISTLLIKVMNGMNG